MKRLFIYICCAILACAPCMAKDKSQKKAAQEALVAAINASNFNVTLTQNIPKTSDEPIVQFTGDGYIIRIRGNKATLFIPGVNNGGTMAFGGNYEGLESPELVDASCELKSHKGKIWTFVLKQLENASNEVTLKVSDNGAVRVTVDRMPMTHFSFYAEASIPED